MTALNLATQVLSTALPQTPAVHEPGRTWSYGELDDVAGRVGGALWELGVRPGERVALLMPDGLEAAATILGAIRIGAVAVPLSELSRPNDLRAMVRDCGAVVAVVHAKLAPVLDEVRREMPSLLEVIAVGGARGAERDFATLTAAAPRAPAAQTQSTDPALIMYSVGAYDTAPRGVVHTHGGPLAAFEGYGKQVLGLGPGDRVFSIAKLSTSYGLGAGLIFPLAAGAQSVLLPTQPHTRDVLTLVKTHAPTVLFATPSVYSQILMDVDGGAQALSGLRAAISGAENMPAVLWARVQVRLGCDVRPGFGLTEAFHFVIASSPARTKPGAAGIVVPGCEARVVDDDGKPCAPFELGTLEVKAPSMGAGYWNRPEETAQVFRGEWLRTHDRFMVDADGYYYHGGRADGMFKVGGKWVSPLEVEHTLVRHEAVWECAVIGVDDENGLQKPLALVVPNVGQAPGPELERELIEYVKRELAPYKYPRWIDFVDAIPKGRDGRVLRFKLAPLKRRRRGTIPPGGG